MCRLDELLKEITAKTSCPATGKPYWSGTKCPDGEVYYLLVTSYYLLLLTAYYSLLTTHYLLLTTHYLLLTTHYSLLTTYY